MKKNLIFLLFFALTLNWVMEAYGEKSTYQLTVDGTSFELNYELSGNVIAMAIDQELDSFLVGIENTKDSVFSIELPYKMISAENNEFAVLVDGFEIEYDIATNENNSVLTFFIPEGSQEIEIIGTHVIPEFPIGTMYGLIIMTILVVIVTKFHKSYSSNNFF